MTQFYSFILFFAFLLLSPLSLRADVNCDCTITKGNALTLFQPIYSDGCGTKKDICNLTVGEGLGAIDLRAFTDLRDVTVTVLGGSQPEFLATTLINNATEINLDVLDGVVATDAAVKILLNGEVLQVFDDNGDFDLLGGTLLNLGLCLDVDLGVNVLGLLTIDLGALDPLDLACTFVEVVNQILPVDLTSWTTETTSRGVALNWQTATETDNDYYKLSHSTTGKVYSEIARITGKGTSGNISDYYHLHATPASGTNYYRLEQVDFDGAVHDLGIQSAEWTQDSPSALLLTPNPVAAGATLRMSGRETAPGETAALIDASGRLMGQYPLALDGSLQLPSDLTPGMYVLRYQDEVARILINR